eukprot:gene26395-17489_t
MSVFGLDNQEGDYFDVLVPQGNNPLSRWKVAGASKSLEKSYDKDLKGHVFVSHGAARLHIPKEPKLSLGLVHPNLVFQVFINQGQGFSAEVSTSDSTGVQRRLVISSTYTELRQTALSCQNSWAASSKISKVQISMAGLSALPYGLEFPADVRSTTCVMGSHRLVVTGLIPPNLSHTPSSTKASMGPPRNILSHERGTRTPNGSPSTHGGLADNRGTTPMTPSGLKSGTPGGQWASKSSHPKGRVGAGVGGAGHGDGGGLAKAGSGPATTANAGVWGPNSTTPSRRPPGAGPPQAPSSGAGGVGGLAGAGLRAVSAQLPIRKLELCPGWKGPPSGSGAGGGEGEVGSPSPTSYSAPTNHQPKQTTTLRAQTGPGQLERVDSIPGSPARHGRRALMSLGSPGNPDGGHLGTPSTGLAPSAVSPPNVNRSPMKGRPPNQFVTARGGFDPSCH